MSYSDFTIKQVQKDFGLEIVEQSGIFAQIKPVAISDYPKIEMRNNNSVMYIKSKR